MSTTLPLYWNLSSASKEERLDASVKLVSSLQQFQLQLQRDEDENLTFEESNSEDVKYALKRLVRGLASPRESSRLGFAVALTELLSRLDTIPCTHALSLILETSQFQGSSYKGQEERDQMFARLFGLTSLIQSRLLFRSPATLDDFQKVVTELFNLSFKKSWLSESCWWSVILAMEALHDSTMEWKEEATEWILDLVYSSPPPTNGDANEERKYYEWSLEKLAFTLRMQSLLPSSLVDESKWASLLSPTFKNGQVLSLGSLATVSKILRDTSLPDQSDTTSKSSGTWKPQLHYVWSIILDAYFTPTPNSQSNPPTSEFREFFRVCVEESLFASTASAERKSWGFQVFSLSLVKLSSSASAPEQQNEIPSILFTKNFMRTWINHLSKVDRYLHGAAKKVVSDIHKFITQSPSLALPLVLQLQNHTALQFDKITRTKTVEGVLGGLSVDGVGEYVGFLVGQFLGDEEFNGDPSSTDSKRLWVLDQLSSLIRNGSIPKDDAWRTSVVEFFVLNGWFEGVKRKKEKKGSNPGVNFKSIPNPPLSDKIRKECRTRLFTCLGELTSQQSRSPKGSSKQPSTSTSSSKSIGRTATTSEFWISLAVSLLKSFANDTKHFKSVGPDTGIGKEVLVGVEGVLGLLRSVNEDKRDAAGGAELLVQSLVLQAFNGEDVSEQIEDALKATRLLFSFPQPSPSDGDDDELMEEDPETPPPKPIDVLIDIIISYLEHSTTFSRTVATQSFGMLSEDVGASSVDLILAQLDQRDVGADDEDKDEIDDGSHDEEEVPSEDKDESDEDSDDDEEKEDAEEEEEDDPELRRRLGELLKVNGVDRADEESGSGEENESDDEVMDDDQMMKLDEHLAQIFRSSQAAATAKNDRQGAEREATHFKIRILDLLDLYAKKQPRNSQILRFILPLIQISRTTSGGSEEQLATKATSVLQRIAKSKEAVKIEGDGQDTAKEILKEIHDLARKAPNGAFLSTLSLCSLFVTRALLLADPSASPFIVEQYIASLEDFITRKNSGLHMNFFLEFIRRQPVTAWGLRENLVSLCGSSKSVNVYRQLQAFNLLQASIEHGARNSGDVDVLAFLPASSKVVYDELSAACDEEARALSGAQIKDLFKVALSMVRLTKQLGSKLHPNSKPTKGVWNVEAVRKLGEKFNKSSRFQASGAVQALCKQLLALVESTPSEGDVSKNGGDKGDERKKRKVDDTAEVGEKKKNRKKSKKDKGYIEEIEDNDN